MIGTMYYQLEEFSYKGNLIHAEGIHSLDIAQLLLSFDECVMWPIHVTGGSIGHPGETTQGNRRLGGLEEIRHMLCLFSSCEHVLRDCTES